MIEQLTHQQIKIGAHILRNDVVPSVWLEDRINSGEKLVSFLKSYRMENDKTKFKIIL